MRAVLFAAALSHAALAGAQSLFFDDFSEPDIGALQRHGWTMRLKPGHPGVEGASWGADMVALVDDPGQRGNRLLRLTARTDGSVAGTWHAQVCHARKYFEGTYAARVRFTDAPARGPGGDVVVQTFYAVGPLRFDFDPEYSELDWEYLPNGGWDDPRTRLYGVTWHTVRLDPWTAYNQPLQLFRSMAGWHTLVIQASGGRTRWFVDGRQVDEHGGRNYPAVAMAIQFNLWFAPGGLLPGEASSREYQEDVDWVLHAKDRVLSPAEVDATVRRLRDAGTAFVDEISAANPPLASTCDF